MLFASRTDEGLRSLQQLAVEEMLLPILLQLAIIILAARLFAIVFRRLGQPSVVGEIAAGLVLGPSVLRLGGHRAFFPRPARRLGDDGSASANGGPCAGMVGRLDRPRIGPWASVHHPNFLRVKPKSKKTAGKGLTPFSVVRRSHRPVE
jgi:hypothetical protein